MRLFILPLTSSLRIARICEPAAVRAQGAIAAILSSGSGGSHLRFVEHFETGGEAVLRSACRLSLEGIVSKRASAAYVSGRSDTWAKSKCRAGHEIVLGGYATTNGKFRSLLAGVHRGESFVYVGRVGTGFGAEKVKSLLPKLKAVKTSKSPFTGNGAPKKEPGSSGSDLSWWPRLSLRAGRLTVLFGRPLSKPCVTTSLQRRWRLRSLPRRLQRSAAAGEPTSSTSPSRPQGRRHGRADFQSGQAALAWHNRR